MRKILYFVASICRLPLVAASPPLRLRFSFGFGFALVLPQYKLALVFLLVVVAFGFSISACLRFGFLVLNIFWVAF